MILKQQIHIAKQTKKHVNREWKGAEMGKLEEEGKGKVEISYPTSVPSFPEFKLTYWTSERKKEMPE